MKNIIKLLAFVPFLISCGDDDADFRRNGCVVGSGNTTTETRTVDPFHSINASMVGDIFITQGSPQELRIVTHPLVLTVIETEVVNEELFIDFEDCVDELETLDIFITTPDIQSISFSGVGSVTSLNDFDLAELRVNQSGVGNIMLSGEVTDFHYIMSGVSDLRAFDLITTTSDIILSGVGNVEITALEELDVIISGLGDVSYKGDPIINSTISGTGNLIDSN